MNYEIVELNIDDVESYIRINSLAWKQSYKGIVNDDFLELILKKKFKKVLIT